MTDQATSKSRRTHSRSASLAVPTLWGFGRRLFPTATFLAAGAVSCAWAVASGLDAPIEATVVAVVASVALSIVFLDPATPITAASVVPLAGRRTVPALLGLGVATSVWLAARTLASAVGPAPWPGRWALLEWLTIAMSQLAVGAAVSRSRAGSTSFGPGLVVALIWYLTSAAPHLHPQLFDPVDHPVRWLALFAGCAAAAVAASLDPARRTSRGVLP